MQDPEAVKRHNSVTVYESSACAAVNRTGSGGPATRSVKCAGRLRIALPGFGRREGGGGPNGSHFGRTRAVIRKDPLCEQPARALAGGDAGAKTMVNPSGSAQPPPGGAGTLPWKRCAGCGGKIADRFLLYAMDSYWHSRCLKCSCCQAQLGEIGTSCYTKSGMILCRNDYIRISPLRCHRCLCLPSWTSYKSIRTFAVMAALRFYLRESPSHPRVPRFPESAFSAGRAPRNLKESGFRRRQRSPAKAAESIGRSAVLHVLYLPEPPGPRGSLPLHQRQPVLRTRQTHGPHQRPFEFTADEPVAAGPEGVLGRRYAKGRARAFISALDTTPREAPGNNHPPPPSVLRTPPADRRLRRTQVLAPAPPPQPLYPENLVPSTSPPLPPARFRFCSSADGPPGCVHSFPRVA
ncbi:LIM domain transcription factor LMO4-like [Arapaima gigas]